MKLRREDLEMLREFLDTLRASGTTCFLVGAGARFLTLDRRWNLRGARATLDWDFAVRIESWERWSALANALLGGRPPSFTRGSTPQRFVHRNGSVLDLVPYGRVEAPSGEIAWPDETRMNVLGFLASEQHLGTLDVEGLIVPVAAAASLALLKLHAYRDRRARGEGKDIQDFDWILRNYEAAGNEDRVFDEIASVVREGRIDIQEAGSTLLGLDVATLHSADVVEPARPLLVEARDGWSRIVTDVLRSSANAGDESRARKAEGVVSRFAAFELGLELGVRRGER